jgi:acetoin utilization deacetylase AcuC-like enzyme
MHKILIRFHPNMEQLNNSFSPSAFKPGLVIKDWEKKFHNSIQICSFSPLKKEIFYLTHDKNYVDGIFSGTIKNGFGFKDSNFSSTFLYTTASLYEAAQDALKYGIGVSPTSGFHHARFDKSEGFCTFNGLIVTANLLQKNNLAKTIGILDFDMHYGNGTDELIKKLHMVNIVHYTAGAKYDLHNSFIELFKPVIKKIYNKFFTTSNNNTPIPKLRQKILKDKGQAFILELPKILEKFKNIRQGQINI